MFDRDPSVLYVSLHRYDGGSFYPGTGGISEVSVARDMASITSEMCSVLQRNDKADIVALEARCVRACTHHYYGVVAVRGSEEYLLANPLPLSAPQPLCVAAGGPGTRGRLQHQHPVGGTRDGGRGVRPGV